MRRHLRLNLIDSLVFWLGICVFLLTRFSLHYGAGSDPKFTLIVSQSVLENGTIRLDAYQDDEIWGVPANFEANFNIVQRNGRYYNYFPVGPSILSIPFVAVANLVGWDMRVTADNINAQVLLSSFSCMLALWLVYGIARAFLDRKSSLLIALISVMGSTLISSMAIGLWSINFNVTFISLTVLLLVRFDQGYTKTIHPYLLGTLLFLAYFSRAAAVAFIVPVLAYLWLKDRRQLVKTAVPAALLLILFLIWSQWEFGSWLPDYFSVARLQVARGPLWVALYGHLFSPARGLFVFSPFLLLAVPGLALSWPEIDRQPLLWLCLSWIGLHLLIASRATVWWGGDSFGPRLLSEIMLAFVVLTAWLWSINRRRLKRPWPQGIAASYLLLGIVGIFIHSYQGLFNYSTALWNSVATHSPAPPVTPVLGDLFNWRYPQFLATNEALCAFDRERTEAVMASSPALAVYPWGEPIRYQRQPITTASTQLRPSPPAFFTGMNPVNTGRARYPQTMCDAFQVMFQAGDVTQSPYEIVLVAQGFGEQRARISVNGHYAGEWVFRQPGEAGETAVIRFDGNLLKPHALNQITVALPDTFPTDYNDPSRMGLAVAELQIRPVAER